MAAPAIVGGAELDLEERLRLIEEISVADGSAGWTVALGNKGAIALSRCPAHVFQEIYAGGPNVVIAGGTAPSGFADIVDGGYRASGRWWWGSGSLHADLFLMNCVVREDGSPIPETRTMVLTRDQVEILDNWHVSGLRGTGSHDIVVKDACVRQDWSLHLLAGDSFLPGAVYKSYPAQSPMHFAAVALGIAQGALDDIVALAVARKQRLYASSKMAETPLFQYKLGHADIALHGARAALHACARTYTETADTISPGFMQLFDPLTKFCNATAAWVAQTAAGVVDIAYHAGGGSSVQDASPLQRRFRDVHALTQHISFSDAIVTRYGASLVGVEEGM